MKTRQAIENLSNLEWQAAEEFSANALHRIAWCGISTDLVVVTVENAA
ncbi:MAG TPA: hypothetical protein VHV10_06525 [Ktedonobacteraceae bacterium]|nr:hypothetical protein [Ktedonobacteraceae bacterium]